MPRTKKKEFGQELLSKIQAEFDPSNPIPKYFQIQSVIKSQILDGNLKPGDEIPSVYRLADTFNITSVTADRALYELEKEHLVRRIRGQGTFVARTRERIEESHLAALFMPAHGHLFGEFARHLIRVVQESGFNALIHDLIDRSPQKLLEKLEKLIASDMGVFIIDGVDTFPFDKLPDSDGKTIIFIFRFESLRPFPNAFKVLHDSEAGGYMVMKHFFSLGHRKILFYSHHIQPGGPYIPNLLLKGMYRAFEEKGFNIKESLVIETVESPGSKSNMAGLVKILSGNHRPTAVFTFQDVAAKDIFSAARELGLSIPDDLAVAGYYNTPWCEMLPVPLTSVSVETDKIADRVRDILLRRQRGEKISERCIMVKPRLVIRESTGCKITKEGADAMNKEHCIARPSRR